MKNECSIPCVMLPVHYKNPTVESILIKEHIFYIEVL